MRSLGTRGKRFLRVPNLSRCRVNLFSLCPAVSEFLYSVCEQFVAMLARQAIARLLLNDVSADALDVSANVGIILVAPSRGSPLVGLC